MDARWEILVSGARAMMADRQSATLAKFGVNFSMQFEWNTERAEMVFSSMEIPIVRANLQFVGSIAGKERTWLWGWANKSVPTAATHRLSEVHKYGQDQGFQKLTQTEYVSEGDEGYDLMFVSASVLESQAVFCDSVGNMELFFVLDGFQYLGDSKIANSQSSL